MKKDEELYDVDVFIKYETHLAFLLESDDSGPTWFPKSEVELDRKGSDKGILTCPAWLLEAKGWS
jgi:hypothetical protein